jgi:uncharacterized integral membrane protein
MAGVGLIIIIVIALLEVVFVIQNAATVSVSFLFWTAELPLAAVIVISVLAGALLMFCLTLYRNLRGYLQKRAVEKGEPVPKVKKAKKKGKSGDDHPVSAAGAATPPEEGNNPGSTATPEGGNDHPVSAAGAATPPEEGNS